MPRFIERAPESKRAAGALARVSEAGTFEGYASLFGVVDTANDEVARGAFRDSLQKRGAAGVKMLWQHQAAEPIGSWLSIAEDARGLKVVGKLNLAVARAREVLALMREGAVDGLSIGFRTERAGVDRMSGVRRLYRLDLWEISIVTFPALPQARVSAIKDSSPTLRPSPHRSPVTLDVLCMKLARLRAHLAATNFEVKLLRLSRALDTRYDPNQPRVPAGSPQGGQWTSGGGSGAANDGSSDGGSDAGGEPADAASNDDLAQVAQNDTGVVSDAGNAYQEAQLRPPRGTEPEPITPGQQERLDRAQELERDAVNRVHEVDPNWRPEPVLVAPRDVEAEIAHSESVTRQANERDAFLRGAEKGLPRGFPSEQEYAVYGETLRDGLRKAGYPDADVVMRGSAVTGESFRTKEPFDDESDFDIAIISPMGMRRARELGIELRSSGARTASLKRDDLKAMGLLDLYDYLENLYGRETSFMFYESSRAVIDRGDYMLIP